MSQPLIAAPHPEPNEQEANKIGGVLKEKQEKKEKERWKSLPLAFGKVSIHSTSAVITKEKNISR